MFCFLFFTFTRGATFGAYITKNFTSRGLARGGFGPRGTAGRWRESNPRLECVIVAFYKLILLELKE